MKVKEIGILVLIGLLLLGTTGFVSATEAVHFNTLIAFLPAAPTGYEGEEPFGMTNTYEGGTWSMATRSYSKVGTEDMTADVMISDYIIYHRVVSCMGGFLCMGNY